MTTKGRNLVRRVNDLFAKLGINLRDRPPQEGTLPSSPSSGGSTPTVTVALTENEALSLGVELSPSNVAGDLGTFLTEHGVSASVVRQSQPGMVSLVSMNEHDVECLEEALTG